MRRALAALVLGSALVLGASAARAQAPDPSAPPASSAERDAVTRVHASGGYPDDVFILDEEHATDSDGLVDDGHGTGPHGRIGLHGDRDGGEPDQGIDLPMPDFLRDLLEALGRILGTAARPIGYVLFGLGIALVVALVVFLIVRMRLPKPEITLPRRKDAGAVGAPALDPLLEGDGTSPEDHAAQGRFREAIHALFLRALREATARADVDRRGRTAREVVALVARAHGELPPLGELLGLTELVWFGGRAATEAQYVEARGLAAAVSDHARRFGAALPLGAPA